MSQNNIEKKKLEELSEAERNALFQTAAYAAKCGVALREKYPSMEIEALSMLAARETLRALDDAMKTT